MNNTIKDCFFELFLNPQDVSNGEGGRFLGFAFFRIGMGIGALFLFAQATPFVEHLELGISSFLLFVGGLLLFFNRRKKYNFVEKDFLIYPSDRKAPYFTHSWSHPRESGEPGNNRYVLSSWLVSRFRGNDSMGGALGKVPSCLRGIFSDY